MDRNVEFLFESSNELKFLWILQASPMFDELWEQPPAIGYVDDEGVRRSHTFDFFARTHCGLRVYFDFKPKERVESSGIRNVHRSIRQQHGTTYADRMLLRTEDHIHPDDVADAFTVLRARRMRCAVADEAIANLVATMNGWVRVRDLVAASGLAARAYNAVARMIGAGVLKTDERGPLSYGSQVMRVVGFAAGTQEDVR